MVQATGDIQVLMFRGLYSLQNFIETDYKTKQRNSRNHKIIAVERFCAARIPHKKLSDMSENKYIKSKTLIAYGTSEVLFSVI